MSLNSVLSATGIAAVLYSAYRLAAFMNVYLRPSSLEKYLSNGAYAVVTGATDGIGKATAMELAGRGFNIVLHGRDNEKLDVVKSQIHKTHAGRDVVTIVHDAGASSRLVFQRGYRQGDHLKRSFSDASYMRLASAPFTTCAGLKCIVLCECIPSTLSGDIRRR